MLPTYRSLYCFTPLRFLALCMSILPGLVYANSLIMWHTLERNYEMIDGIADSYGQQTADTINTIALTPEQSVANIIYAAAANINPDILLLPADQLNFRTSMRVSNLPLDLNDIDINAFPNIDFNALPITFTQGHFLLFYYNKKLVPKAPETWAELAEIARQENKPVVASRITIPYWLNPLLNELDYFSAPKAQQGEILIRAIMQTKQAINDNIIDARCISVDCVQERFESGQIPFAIDGDWSFHYYRQLFGDDLGIATLPRWSTKEVRSMRIPYLLLFGKIDDKERALAALKFVDYMRSRAIQQRIYTDYSLRPSVNLAEPAGLQPKSAHFLAVIGRDHTYLPPETVNVSILWELARTVLEDYLHDRITDAELRAIINSKTLVENTNDER